MSSSASEAGLAEAQSVMVTDDMLIVDLVDGRRLSVPLAWYPRLANGTPEERSEWQIIGRGVGIHWPRLDEDISVEGLLAGKASGESRSSLEQWLRNRERASQSN